MRIRPAKRPIKNKMLFNDESTQAAAQKELQAGIIAQYVSVETFCLNSDYDSLCIVISLEARECWPHGYLVNSRFVRLYLENTGACYQFSGRGLKFRKFTGKSIAQIIERINAKVSEALKG